MGVPSRLSSGMEAGHPPPEEQVAEKPDLEKGGSCNSGDEGIDTTEPVDEIEGDETDEPVGKTEEFDKSGSTEKIEEKDSSEPSNDEAEPIGGISDQEEEAETNEDEPEENEATEKQVENVESTTPLMEEEQEKSAREILLEKKCSLTHTPDIDRVLDKEAAKASSGEVHEFQKVKSELKAVDEQQVAELKISQGYEGVSEETGRSENHFLQDNVTKSDFVEVTTDGPEEKVEEEEEEEEVSETILELTLAPTPMIMDLTPAPVEMVKESEVSEKRGGEKGGGNKVGSASKGKNEKNGLRCKNRKGKKEDTDKKKAAGSNGVVKTQAPDIIKEAVVATNGQTTGKSGKAGSPTRKVVAV